MKPNLLFIDALHLVIVAVMAGSEVFLMGGVVLFYIGVAVVDKN